MKVIQKIASLLIVGLLSITSRAMVVDKEKSPVFLDALIRECFKYADVVDLAQCSAVSQQWKKCADTDKLWAFLARHYGADIFKEKGCSWQQAIQNSKMILHVLRMGTWNKKEIEFAISDKGNALLEKLLLKQFTQTFIEKIPQIKTSKDYLTAFLLYTVDMSAIWNASWNIATVAAGDAGKKAAQTHSYSSSWNIAGDIARNVAKNEAYITAHDVIWQASWRATREAIYSVAGNVVGRAINILNLDPAVASGEAASKLSGLFALAIASQAEYFNDRSDIFLASTAELDRKNFSQTIGEICSILSTAMWDNAALVENMHIVAAEHIFNKKLACKFCGQQEEKGEE